MITTAPVLVAASPRVIPGGQGRSGSVQRALQSVVSALSAAFPAHSGDQVREVVYSTYEQLASTAKITAYLIPLTINRAQARLMVSGQDAQRPLASGQ
ncbi:MAG: hypothetical protein ABI251_14055 [Mycobacteriaceae bacterium]